VGFGISDNGLRIKEVAEGNFGKSMISLLSAVMHCFGAYI